MIEVEVSKFIGTHKHTRRYEFSDYISAKQAADIFNRNAINTTAEVVRTIEDDTLFPHIVVVDENNKIMKGSNVMFEGGKLPNSIFVYGISKYFIIISIIDEEEIYKRGSSIIINNIEIDDKIFDKRLVDYKLVNRQDLIQNMKILLCLLKYKKEKELAEKIIKNITALDDAYFFYSDETWEYVSIKEEPFKFRDICLDIFEANEKYGKRELIPF